MPAAPGTKPLKKLKPGMGLYQVFYWPDKAPDKSKPYAVANLQTGDVNGRWHATREGALSQARALYARLGEKAKVHSEIRSAFFFSADSATLLDGTEDGVKWIEAIEPKTYTVPVYGDVVITPQKLDNFIHNINNNVRGQEIATDYEHGMDSSKGRKASGWIRGARKNEKGNLELAVDFTETAKKEIQSGEWKYFSLEWDDLWEHPDGMVFEDVVMGGGLTNRPVAKGLMPINFSEIFVENDPEFEFAVWTTAYMNTLPDSSFAYVEPGGSKDSEGKTQPRSLRHFPYKDASGKIDLAHVRNMIARAPQANVPAAVKARVQALGRKLLGAKSMSELMEVDTEFVNESKEMEHSEPGTGSPPQPRTDGDGHDDPAIEEGWRRNTPPIAEDVFKFTEEHAVNYLTQSATALSEYASEEPDNEDVVFARGLVASIAQFMDNETKKYSEYTDLCLKAKKFFEKKTIEDKNLEAVSVKFTEQEAIGYLTSSKAGLVRVHTNAANDLIEEIDKMLAQDFRKRSFSELQSLVSKARSMLRGDDSNTSTTTTTTSTTIPSKGGNTVGELTEKDLRELRNVLDVDDDGKILEAVQHKFGELHALRDAVSATEQERVFAEQYPQFYEQHRMLMERDRRNSAKTFAESVQGVRKNEGYGLKQTRMGLSTATLEKLSNAHMKFSEGQGTLDDFEEVVKSIMHGGIVQFGEIGSSNEEALPEIDSSSHTGVAQGRILFAEQVAKIQRDNPEMDLLTASAEAAKKHPDLADLYKVTLPA